jgi:flagellar biosynthesis/type III secretory pathway protein FliH
MDILQRMPFLAQDAVFKRLSEIAEVGSMTKEERRQYDESLKHYRDTIAVMQGQYLEGMEKGRAEGMEIGMEKGMEKGIATANRANARRMKADSMSTELIMKYCGLTRQEVEEL